ncbi:hypothetical protein D9M72_330750 [compost metagenome]
MRLQDQIPEVAGSQRDQVAGIDGQQCRGFAPVTFQMLVIGVRVANRQRRFLGDPVIVERLMARRTLHLVELGVRPHGRPVQHGQVITFHEVLSQDLPVGVPDVLFLEGLDVVLHAVVGDEVFELAQVFGNRRQAVIEGHVHPALPYLATHAGQLVVALAEPALAMHLRRSAQFPLQVIAPRVVRTDDGAHIPAALQQYRHAMQADVGKRADFVLVVAQHHHRLASDVAGHVIAGLLQAAGAAHAQPLGAKQMLFLEFQELRRGVDRRRHCAGIGEVPITVCL